MRCHVPLHVPRDDRAGGLRYVLQDTSPFSQGLGLMSKARPRANAAVRFSTRLSGRGTSLWRWDGRGRSRRLHLASDARAPQLGLEVFDIWHEVGVLRVLRDPLADVVVR